MLFSFPPPKPKRLSFSLVVRIDEGVPSLVLSSHSTARRHTRTHTSRHRSLEWLHNKAGESHRVSGYSPQRAPEQQRGATLSRRAKSSRPRLLCVWQVGLLIGDSEDTPLQGFRATQVPRHRDAALHPPTAEGERELHTPSHPCVCCVPAEKNNIILPVHPTDVATN